MFQASPSEESSIANDGVPINLPSDATTAIVAEAVDDFREIALRMLSKRNLASTLVCTNDVERGKATVQTVAKQIVHARAKSDKLFQRFGASDGPHVDILLDLFISEGDNRNVSISDACIASRCPATTALRWLCILEAEGLILKKPDQSDQRRSFMSLTPEGRTIALQCIAVFSSIAAVKTD